MECEVCGTHLKGGAVCVSCFEELWEDVKLKATLEAIHRAVWAYRKEILFPSCSHETVVPPNPA